MGKDSRRRASGVVDYAWRQSQYSTQRVGRRHLRGRFGMARIFVEAARRENFSGISGRTRNYISGAASFLLGPWQFSLTSTQRRTTDSTLPGQRDRLYTTSLGYTLPSRTVLAWSIGHEEVGSQCGAYVGLRITAHAMLQQNNDKNLDLAE